MGRLVGGSGRTRLASATRVPPSSELLQEWNKSEVYCQTAAEPATKLAAAQKAKHMQTLCFSG
jgi:hypothetical protein